MKAVDKRPFCEYNNKRCLSASSRSWRNWHTRTFEGRVLNRVRVQVPSTAPETWAIKIRYCSKHNPCYHGGCAFLLAVWRPFLSIHNAAFCMFFFLCLTHFSLCVILLVSIVCFTRLTHFSDNKKRPVRWGEPHVQVYFVQIGTRFYLTSSSLMVCSALFRKW